MTLDPERRAELMLALGVGEGAVDRLAAILADVPVASVILRGAPGRSLAAADVMPVIQVGQKAGVSMLVADDARLARATRADGVHIGVCDQTESAFQEARAVVGGRAVVGADAGRSRHAAMMLGELGADYVAFGIPDFVKDRETASERQLELIAWWAEIFEIPCVATDVASIDQARALARAGADFVCLPIEAGMAISDAVEVARAWSAAIDAGPTDVHVAARGEGA